SRGAGQRRRRQPGVPRHQQVQPAGDDGTLAEGGVPRDTRAWAAPVAVPVARRMAAMTVARRILAFVVAALQLTLPLAAYARTPFVPGAGDICSVARALEDHRPGPQNPQPATPLHGH